MQQRRGVRGVCTRPTCWDVGLSPRCCRVICPAAALILNDYDTCQITFRFRLKGSSQLLNRLLPSEARPRRPVPGTASPAPRRLSLLWVIKRKMWKRSGGFSRLTLAPMATWQTARCLFPVFFSFANSFPKDGADGWSCLGQIHMWRRTLSSMSKVHIRYIFKYMFWTKGNTAGMMSSIMRKRTLYFNPYLHVFTLKAGIHH